MKLYDVTDHENPEWEKAGRVHEWKNYIHDDLRHAWHSFTPEQRKLIAQNAQEQADQEEWD